MARGVEVDGTGFTIRGTDCEQDAEYRTWIQFRIFASKMAKIRQEANFYIDLAEKGSFGFLRRLGSIEEDRYQDMLLALRFSDELLWEMNSATK